MKTLADVKRRAISGAVLTMTFHAYGAPKLVGKPRTIKRTQGNAITLLTEHADGACESWLYWPKASELHVTGPDSFDVLFPDDETGDPVRDIANRGKVFMSYRFETETA